METYCFKCQEIRHVASVYSYYQKSISDGAKHMLIPLQVGVCPHCHRLLCKVADLKTNERYLAVPVSEGWRIRDAGDAK